MVKRFVLHLISVILRITYADPSLRMAWPLLSLIEAY